jgi:hypothetical protein
MPKYLYDWDSVFASKKSFCSNQLISTEYEYDTAEQEDEYNKR